MKTKNEKQIIATLKRAIKHNALKQSEYENSSRHAKGSDERKFHEQRLEYVKGKKVAYQEILDLLTTTGSKK